MATKIVTKNSSTASAVPTASDLVQGELAVNVADKRLFTEDNGGAIVELGTNPSTIDINAGTIDGTTIGASSASTGAFTTLTASGLTVDTNTLYVDATNNRVGIGTTSPSHPLTIQADGTSGNSIKIIGDSTNNTGRILWRNSADSSETGRISVDGSSNLTMHTGSGGSERMRIDSSGNVGIGTSSPTSISGYTALEINNATSGALLDLSQGDSMRGRLIATATTMSLETSGSIPIIFQPTGVERMRIDSSGNVGVGTSSPSRKVHIDGGSTDAAIQFTNTNTGSTGNDGTYIGHAGTGTDFQLFNYETGYMRFGTAGTERMRIDSSGDLLVNTTSSGVWSNATQSVSDNGHSLRNDGIQGSAAYKTTANVGYVQYLNRTGSDGGITAFYKNGTTVGSIGAYSGTLAINSVNTGIMLDDTNNVLRPTNASGGSRDAIISLGTSSQRFKDLYLSGGAYLGGTGSANKLDDYEEGTWTPAENNLTFTTASGRYTKIGNLVHALGYVEVPINTNGNTFDISLPFASGDSTVVYFTCSVTSTGLADTAGLLGPAGNGYIAVINKDTEARTLLSAASNKAFRFNITYRTA